MPIYQYRAKNQKSETVAGTVEAASEISAQEALEEKRLFVISLLEKGTGSVFGSPIQLFNRIPVREVVIFLRQLSVMIQANVPIVKSLRSLADQTERADFKAMVIDISEEVSSGVKLSKTLERYPRVFDAFFINMVRSGETTGKLDEVLVYLADEKEKEYDVSSQIKGAMIYPVFVVTGLVVVASIMMIYVVPRLTRILIDSGETLPLPTRILITTSHLFLAYWWIVLLLVIATVVALRITYRTPEGRVQLDFIKLKIPIFGTIYQKIYLARFCRSLSSLLTSGVPLTQALNISGDIVENGYYQKVIRKTIEEVTAGKSIVSVFRVNNNIPPMLTQMMSVGEETGRLDQILLKLGEFYEKEVAALVRGLVSLVEPLIIILLGIAVAILVTAVLLPMYNLSSTF